MHSSFSVFDERSTIFDIALIFIFVRWWCYCELHSCPWRRLILLLWVDVWPLPFYYPRCKRQNQWRALDIHFQEVVPISSIPFSPMPVFYISIIAQRHCTSVWLSKMHGHKALTFHWLWVVADCSDDVARIIGFEGSQYFQFVSQRMTLLWIIRLRTTKIVKESLTLIPTMGQRACHCTFYLFKRPIQSLWNDVTMELCVCWKGKTKKHWRSIDTQFNFV